MVKSHKQESWSFPDRPHGPETWHRDVVSRPPRFIQLDFAGDVFALSGQNTRDGRLPVDHRPDPCACGAGGPWPAAFLHCPDCGRQLLSLKLGARTPVAREVPGSAMTAAPITQDAILISGYSPGRLPDAMRSYENALQSRKEAERFFVDFDVAAFERTDAVDLVKSDLSMFEAPFWAIHLNGDEWAVFPGFKTYNSQHLLLMGSRLARTSFTPIFLLEPGGRFLLETALCISQENGLTLKKPGRLELPAN